MATPTTTARTSTMTIEQQQTAQTNKIKAIRFDVLVCKLSNKLQILTLIRFINCLSKYKYRKILESFIINSL